MTIKECAQSADTHENTIRNWIKSRGLKAENRGFNNKVYIDPDDWRHFCHEHGIPFKERDNA